MKRTVLAAATCLFALFAPVPAVSAEETWCETDPPVVVKTPAGNLVVVYLVNGGQVEDIASLATPQVSYSAEPALNATTRVVMRVSFTDLTTALTSAGSTGSKRPVISRVWSGPLQTGTLYSEVSGTLDAEVRHEFILRVS